MMLLFSLICIFSLLLQATDHPITITLENVTDMTELKSYADGESFYSDLAFQPGGQVLAVIKVRNEMSLVHDGEVTFLDVRTGEEIPLLVNPIEGMSIAYSSDGTLFAVGSQTGQLTLLDVKTGNPIIEKRLDDGEISDVSIQPENRLVATAIGTLSTVRENKYASLLIDIPAGNTVLALDVSDSPMLDGADGAGVAFLDANMVAVATTDGIIHVWNIATNEKIFQMEGTRAQTRDIITQSESEQVAFINGSQVSLVSLTDDSVGTLQNIAEVPEGNFIRTIAFHPSEPIIAVGYERQLKTGIPGDRDGVIRLWNTETGDELIMLEGHTDIVTDLAFSPDGTLLASGGADGTVRLWGVPGEGE